MKKPILYTLAIVGTIVIGLPLCVILIPFALVSSILILRLAIFALPLVLLVGLGMYIERTRSRK